MRIMLTLGACCLSFLPSLKAHAQCDPPHYRVGRNFSNAALGVGSLYVSVRPGDFSPDKLICLAETMKKQHPEWKRLGILFFTSADAARYFQTNAGDCVRDCQFRAKWQAELHALYSLEPGAQAESLAILPMGYLGSSYDTWFKLPLVTKVRCHLEINERCLMALDKIEYPPLALQAKASGTINVSGTIGSDGKIRRIRVLEANVKPEASTSLLASAAAKNFATWRLEPREDRDKIRVLYTYSIVEPENSADQLGTEFKLPKEVVVRGRAPK